MNGWIQTFDINFYLVDKIEVVHEDQIQTYTVNYTSDSCSIGDKGTIHYLKVLKNPKKQ